MVESNESDESEQDLAERSATVAEREIQQMPEPKRPEPPDPTRTQLNFLSLYLMILGFFVVLISLSKISEERMTQVRADTQLIVNPLVQHLSDTRRYQMRNPGVTAGDILYELENFLKREIDLLESLALKQKLNLFAQMPISELFSIGSARLSERGERILRRIAQSGVNLAQGTQIKRHQAFVIETTLRYADQPAPDDERTFRERRLNKQRLLTMVRFLETNAVPVEMLAIKEENVSLGQLRAALKLPSAQVPPPEAALVLFRLYPLVQAKLSAGPYHLIGENLQN